MKSYTIHLIRHGAIAETNQGKYIGSTDAHLSEHAKDNLRIIRDNEGYPYVEKIFSSPLSRCTETCSVIYPKRPIKTMGFLSECDFGDWEGKTAAELAGNPQFAAWLSNSDTTPPPNGESGKDFALRVCKGFEHLVNQLLTEGITNSAIVTHGGVIMTILAMYGIPQAPAYQWRMDCGYGFSLRVTPFLWSRDKVVEVYNTVPKPPKKES